MKNTREMPLSPHLSIYKPQISSVLSIFHRISGIALFIGMLLFLWWIVFICYNPDPENTKIWKFFQTIYGKGLLVIWSYSLFFHFCTGIRHLMWDQGHGFSIPEMNRSGWFAVILSIILTAVSWYLVFNLGI